jgi:hypothetical protein
MLVAGSASARVGHRITGTQVRSTASVSNGMGLSAATPRAVRVCRVASTTS